MRILCLRLVHDNPATALAAYSHTLQRQAVGYDLVDSGAPSRVPPVVLSGT